MAIELASLRSHVEYLFNNNAYESCSFLATKLATLSGYVSSDVYLLARSFYATEQPLRAVELLEKHGLLTRSSDEDYLKYLLLAAQCWSKVGRSEEVLRVTDVAFADVDPYDLREARDFTSRRWGREHFPLLSLISLERGRAYDSQDNRKKCLYWMKQALHFDVRTTEALDHIVNAQLTPGEEALLMTSLTNSNAFTTPATAWLESVYRCCLGKYDCSIPSDLRFNQVARLKASPEGPSLQGDIDILAVQAEARYHQRDTRGAFELSRLVFELDPSNFQRAALVHIAALVELNKTSDLFYFAHREVKEYPKKAISWYAVGAYYYSAKKFDASRRFFNRATAIDPGMLAAWIGSAHAHAMHDESDRAMAIYRTAARLFPGSHIPVVGTAMEYLRTNNVALAEQFCHQALALCEVDPAIYNELGVVCYRMRRFEEAADYFDKALKRRAGLTERVLSLAFESVTFNLGHALRRAGRFQAAIEAYKLGLARTPKSASGHASLGLAYHMNNETALAVEEYHVSLGIKPGDTVVEELMEMALRDMAKVEHIEE